MNAMLTMSSSEVRKDWSSVMDHAIRKKPVFIRRTRDHLMLSSTAMISELVADVKYHADLFEEEDGGVTLSLREMDIIAHGENLSVARAALVRDILEYAEEFYLNYERYSAAPNRRGHLPHVIKALTAGTAEELEEAVICQAGRS